MAPRPSQRRVRETVPSAKRTSPCTGPHRALSDEFRRLSPDRLGRLGFLDIGEQLLARHGLLLDSDLAEEMVDGFLLEDRRAQRGARLRIFPVDLPHLPLLARELTGPGDERLCHLVVADGDIGLLPDIRK